MKEVATLPVNTFHNYVYKGTLYSQEGFMTRIYDMSSGVSISALSEKSYVNQISPGGNDYAVDSGKLYILSGSSLEIFDISTPLKQLYPEFLGNISGGGVRIAVNGKYAYITGSGLRVIDISTPSNPIEVSYPKTYSTAAIAFDGRYAYTGKLGSNYFTIWDVTDPSNPVVVNQTKIANDPNYAVKSLAYRNNTLYVACYASNLQTWDVTNRASPVRTDIKYWHAVSLQVFDHYLFMDVRYGDDYPFQSGGFAIYDIVNNIPPAHATGYGGTDGYGGAPFIGYTEDIHTDGTTAAISANTNGLTLYDVSNKSHVVYKTRLNIPATAYAFAATKIGNMDVLALAGRNLGTWYWNITDPEELSFSKPVAEWIPAQTPRQYSSTFYKNYSYVTQGTNNPPGFWSVNLTGIENPGFVPKIGYYDSAHQGQVYFVAANETRAYVDGYDGVLGIWDNTLKDSGIGKRLYVHAISPTSDWANLFFYNNTVSNTHYLMAINGYGIQIFDITSDTPTQVYDGSSVGMSAWLYPAYDPVSNHVYVKTGTGDTAKVKAINVADLNNIHFEKGSVGFVMLPARLACNGTDVFVSGKQKYDTTGDLMMFDFSNPDAPRLIDRAFAPGHGSTNDALIFYNGYLYVGSENAVSVWKVTPSSGIPEVSPVEQISGSLSQRSGQQSNLSVGNQDIINQVVGIGKTVVDFIIRHFPIKIQ
jgi:hypothetical protein